MIALIFTLLSAPAWAQNVLISYAPVFPDHYLAARISILPENIPGFYAGYSRASFRKPPDLMSELRLYGQAHDFVDFRSKVEFGINMRIGRYFAFSVGINRLYMRKDMTVDARRFEKHDGVEVVKGKIYLFEFPGSKSWQTGASLTVIYFADEYVHLMFGYSSIPKGFTAGFGVSMRSLYIKL